VPAPVVAPPPPPPPVPAPAVAKAPAPAPEASSGFLGFDGPTVPAGIGLAALLAGLGGWWWSRRKSKGRFEDTSAPAGAALTTMNPDTVFGTSGLGVVKTNDAPIASQFSRSGMGTIDAGEVDPVAEAEVYIAYGREAQAEEILREALNRDPQRADVATKLAEISATQGNQEAFTTLAKQIAGMDRGAEYAPKLAEYASAHFPGHPLASGAASVATAAMGTISSAVSSAGAVTDSAKDSVKSTVSAMSGSAVAGLAATGAAAAMVGLSKAASNAPASAAGGALDFVLDSNATVIVPKQTAAKPAASSAASLAMGDEAFLKSFDTTPMVAAAPAVTPLGVNTLTGSGKKKSLEDDLADLEASLQKATSSGQLPESGLDFTDFSTATPTNLGPAAPAMRPEMLDLSFDATRQNSVDPTPSILDGQWHDVSTKLDLARAYEEMGDREGAREILREVMHDGNEVQQKEAKALLAKLGG
jgi:pilus assembly protein FimV